ncbi:MAG: hypothetical protein KDC36_06080 [Thermoleophilia bacterium]|nr:hypothetical protein [Thermoleophilia bacterium]
MVLGLLGWSLADAHQGEHGSDTIRSERDRLTVRPFDLLATRVKQTKNAYVFRSRVVGRAGKLRPAPVGQLDGAEVYAYVWPTTLDSAQIGFAPAQGIVALTATSHPDFDDTPLYDENRDGSPDNDGRKWHAHWVVLTESEACPGGLVVKEIPDPETAVVPETWPGLPIHIDSPDYRTLRTRHEVSIVVPRGDLAGAENFRFDGVTAGLRVSTSPHDPLLCVTKVVDVASGDLSLPGKVG